MIHSLELSRATNCTADDIGHAVIVTEHGNMNDLFTNLSMGAVSQDWKRSIYIFVVAVSHSLKYLLLKLFQTQRRKAVYLS